MTPADKIVEYKIVDFLRKNPSCGRAAIAKGTKLKAATLSPVLSRLVAEGRISREGNTRGAVYSATSVH